MYRTRCLAVYQGLCLTFGAEFWSEDMFPYTPHLEILGIFRRSQGDRLLRRDARAKTVQAAEWLLMKKAGRLG